MMKINFEKALKLVDTKGAKLIDTNGPVEFNKKTLPGAVNLVLRNISKVLSICKKDVPVVFFGPDAHMAAQYTFGMGYEKVYYIETLPTSEPETQTVNK